MNEETDQSQSNRRAWRVQTGVPTEEGQSLGALSDSGGAFLAPLGYDMQQIQGLFDFSGSGDVGYHPQFYQLENIPSGNEWSFQDHASYLVDPMIAQSGGSSAVGVETAIQNPHVFATPPNNLVRQQWSDDGAHDTQLPVAVAWGGMNIREESALERAEALDVRRSSGSVTSGFHSHPGRVQKTSSVPPRSKRGRPKGKKAAMPSERTLTSFSEDGHKKYFEDRLLYETAQMDDDGEPLTQRLHCSNSSTDKPCPVMQLKKLRDFQSSALTHYSCSKDCGDTLENEYPGRTIATKCAWETDGLPHFVQNRKRMEKTRTYCNYHVRARKQCLDTDAGQSGTEAGGEQDTDPSMSLEQHGTGAGADQGGFW